MFRPGDKVLILHDEGGRFTGCTATVTSELHESLVWPDTHSTTNPKLCKVHDLDIDGLSEELQLYGPCSEPQFLLKLDDWKETDKIEIARLKSLEFV